MGKKRQTNTTAATSNGYSQQQLVIPGWSGNPGLVGVNLGQCGTGQDPQNGQVRDWNWRPELAYAASQTQTLEGLTAEFGIAQQRLFPAIPRPDLNPPMPTPTSSASASGASSHNAAASNSSLTVPKASKPRRRPKKNAARNSDNNLNQSTSNWNNKATEDVVVEKFVWGGKWECEKLASQEFVCCACGAVKSNRPNLVTHLTYHRLLESKRWACKLCGKAFSRQREVERHERTHLTKGTTKHKNDMDHLGHGQLGSSGGI